MSETIILIFTALFSGIIATVVTIKWQMWNEQRNEKRKIFNTLMAKRYNIAAEDSVNALNSIDAVFYKCPKVRDAWKAFNAATNMPDSPKKQEEIDNKHLKLLEEIAISIGYKEIKWENIKEYYFPVGLSERMRDENVLRRIQIDTGLAQLKKEKEGQEARVDADEELKNKMFFAALENPDSILKLIEVAERAQNIGKGKKNGR